MSITGVSGSGKSTFLYEIIHKIFKRAWNENIDQHKHLIVKVLQVLNMLAERFLSTNLQLVEPLVQIQQHTLVRGHLFELLLKPLRLESVVGRQTGFLLT